MQTLVIDTNGIVKKLEAKGFSRSQAEGITEALKVGHREPCDEGGPRTRARAPDRPAPHGDDRHAPRARRARRRPHRIPQVAAGANDGSPADTSSPQVPTSSRYPS